MEINYEYRRIGPAFQAELLNLVTQSDSAVLLGPRDLGKRFVLRRLAEALRHVGAVTVIDVGFMQDPALVDVEDVSRLVAAAVSRAALDHEPSTADVPAGLLASVRQLCLARPGRVVLLASNVDGLAHHLTQAFLREARVLVTDQQARLTAVLTGEENLSDLVHGPGSDFNCAQQFILQGFEEGEFIPYMRRRGADLADEADLRRLYIQTGGNIHVAQSVLWSRLDLLSRSPEGDLGSGSPRNFAQFLEGFAASEAARSSIFLNSIRVVTGAPAAWNTLEELLAGRSVSVLKQSAPHPLEFAGLVVRSNDQLLEFASPAMAQFARRYYDHCRLGDLHAIDGNWSAAFRLYEQMPVARRLRPAGAADVPRLARVIKAMVAEMHVLAAGVGRSTSAEREQELKRFLIRAGQLVLGVSGISFWQLTDRWEPHEGQSLDPLERNQVADSLEATSQEYPNWCEAGVVSVRRAVLHGLPSLRPGGRDAVVISDAGLAMAVSKERAKLLGELLKGFFSAYDHAVANRRTELRLSSRHKHLEIATRIVNALGTTVVDPRRALNLAGDQLLNLGYRRIMFALVDPKSQRIHGEQFICGDAPLRDVADGTDWSLADWQADVQPWVVHEKRACRVVDWTTWNQVRADGQPPINVPLATEAGTALNFAVVPMFLHIARGESEEQVIGTIHAERKDGQPPSPEDIDDLIELGRQMAALVHKTEQVAALLDALRLDQDVVVILDEACKVAFANPAATKRFTGITAGWHDPSVRVSLVDDSHRQRVQKVLQTGKPIAEHVTNGQHHREAVFCAPLMDWRKPHASDQQPPLVPLAVGAVLHIHDFMGFERVFDALQIVAQKATNRESAVEAILESAQKLDLSSGSVRLYLVEPDRPDVLRSARARGLSAEDLQDFASGKYQMGRNDPKSGDTWISLDTGQPIVCQWGPQARENDETVTPRGVRVRNVRQPSFDQPWKKPGDVWIDLPLQAPGQPIGKLTMSIGEDFRCTLEPEEYELLKLYSSLLGALLAALDKDKWVQEASDRAVAEAAHKIGTKLAGLSGFTGDYRRAAPGNEQVEKINRWIEPSVLECFALVKEVSECFTAGKGLRRTPTPIRALLVAASESLLGQECQNGTALCRVDCPEDITFPVDEPRLRQALEAMLANSRALRAPERKLELSLVAETFSRANTSWLRLTVADNGRGVPPQLRKQIFEPFHSFRPGARRSTGLGLTFVERTVKGHGGTVAAVEPDSPGAKFIIELPEKP